MGYPAPRMTTLGIWLFFLYPPLILAFDGFLKFALGAETISERVWTEPKLCTVACLYMIAWSVMLIAHFRFQVLPGLIRKFRKPDR